MPSSDFFTNCRPNDSRRKTSHLEMYNGDTLSFSLVMNDAGEPIDITGWYFWFTVKDDMNDPFSEAVIAKESGEGITVVNAPLGQLVVTVDPSDTLALRLHESKSFYWDLQYQDNVGSVSTVLSGRLTILLDVTTNATYTVGLASVISTTQITGQVLLAGVNFAVDGDNISINEQQTIHVDGATAGTFTLTVEDPNNPGIFETTNGINYNATALEVGTVLETDISFIDNVTASGGPLGTSPVVVEFDGAIVTLLDFPLMVMDVSGLS